MSTRGESFYTERAKEFAMTTALATVDEDGSKVVDCGEFGNALIMKRDGTTLYLTRDICAIQERIELYSPYKVIYVVSSEQDQHFKQLFCIAEKLGYRREIFEHVNFGMVRGMSTREGTVHFIEDVIEVAVRVIHEFIKDKDSIKDKQQVALTLAISFLLINDFQAKRIKGYAFKIEERAKTEKGQSTGLNLQYTHCRLCGIEEINSSVSFSDADEIDFSLIKEPCVLALAYKLIWFEHVVEQCLQDYEPSRIVQYLKDLGNAINSAINVIRVKGAEPETAKARLAFFRAARIVLCNGIKLLGVVPLSKM